MMACLIGGKKVWKIRTLEEKGSLLVAMLEGEVLGKERVGQRIIKNTI